jgi:two-component system response regulator DegU
MQIVLCDDHEIVREALRRRIEAESGLEVVGEAGDADQVRKVVRELRPELLVTDVELPGSDGIAAAARLVKEQPDLRVLVTSAHEEPALVSFAAESGASGFVGKANVTTELIPAIRALQMGRRWFPNGADSDEDLGDGLRRLRSLSPRERQILDLFATGMRAQGVSEVIGIRPATVYTHVRNAIHKLNVDSRTQAVAIAVRYSYLTNEADG